MAQVIPLTSVRPELDVQAELQWFFQRAESELGLQSTYGAMVAQLSGACSGTGQNHIAVSAAEERRICATHRERRIFRTFRNLPYPSQQTLCAAFAPRAWGPEVRRWFRVPLAGIAFGLVGDLDTFIQKTPKAELRNSVVRCERVYLEACRQYSEIKKAKVAA